MTADHDQESASVGDDSARRAPDRPADRPVRVPRETFAARVSVWAVEHPSVVLAAAFPSFVAFRVLTISQFDPVTALAVVQSTGIATVAIGVLIAMFPLLIAALFVLSVALVVNRDDRGAGRWMWAAALGVFTVATLPGPTALAAVVGAGTSVIPRALMKRRPGRPAVVRVLAKIGRARSGVRLINAAAEVFFVVVLLLSIQPWLAPEVVETSTGDQLSGFVLADGNRPVVLTYADRKVIHLDGPLQRRQLCDSPTSIFDGEPSVLDRVLRHSPYPSCAVPMPAGDERQQPESGLPSRDED